MGLKALRLLETGAKYANKMYVSRFDKLCTVGFGIKPQRFASELKAAEQLGLEIKPHVGDTLQITKRLTKSVISNPTVKKLMDMGINESDAQILAKIMPEKELLDTANLFKESNNLQSFVKLLKDEYKQQVTFWGRELDFSKTNQLVWDTSIGEINIMELTSKHRKKKMFNAGETKYKQIPKSSIITEEDVASKKIVDDAFRKLQASKYDMLQYRGEVISRDLQYVKNLEELKPGEIFEMTGYAWTTDNMQYAFSGYGNADMDFVRFLNRMKIKYHILCPRGTKIMASRSRLGQEFVLPCDSKMRLVKKVVDEEKREIIVYCEHIPESLS